MRGGASQLGVLACGRLVLALLEKISIEPDLPLIDVARQHGAGGLEADGARDALLVAAAS